MERDFMGGVQILWTPAAITLRIYLSPVDQSHLQWQTVETNFKNESC
jgi:hypothetical protein